MNSIISIAIFTISVCMIATEGVRVSAKERSWFPLEPIAEAKLNFPHINKDVPSWIASQKMTMHPPPPPKKPSKQRSNVKTHWIEQCLDHNDDSNDAKWQQRVLTNDEYFQEGGPILVYIGGEWKIDSGSITSGLLVDIAAEHGGTLVYPEHRNFGLSIATKNLTTENLEYHTSEQALADLAHVLDYLKENDDRYTNSKVIISGCSYSATLTVLFRQLYPEHACGAWASSAPLKAKVDFKEYMKVAGQAILELGGEKCYNRVKNGVSIYENWFANGEADTAKAYLHTCDSFDETKDHDVWTLFSTIANLFAGLVQYQHTGDLEKWCGYLDSWAGDSQDDAAAITNFVHARLNYPDCVSAHYDSTINYYKWEQYHYDGDGLAWTYQTCNEFGWFQSSASEHQPFGSSFPAQLYTDTCHDVFGDDYSLENINAKIKATNKKYGGINAAIDNTYQTHGGLDPWHAVGATESQGAVILPLASHCSDLGSISDSDSAEQVASKERVKELVREWLA